MADFFAFFRGSFAIFLRQLTIENGPEIGGVTAKMARVTVVTRARRERVKRNQNKQQRYSPGYLVTRADFGTF